MTLVAFDRSTRHIAFAAVDRRVRFQTIVRLTHDTICFARVCLSVVVMFEAPIAKILGAEEARYAGNGVKVVVVYQVNVDTWTIGLTWIGNKLVSESGADHHHTNIQGFFECRYIV